jgi:cytochrome c peroxidase
MNRRFRTYHRAVAAGLLVAVLASAGQGLAREPAEPVRPARVTNPALVELGKKLFFDPRLSQSGYISCNSCHNLSLGGSDNLRTSIGHQWQRTQLNAPTVLNASLNIAQFWDSRAKDLQAQASVPIAHPSEMAMSHHLAVDVLRSIPGYVGEFNRVFRPGPIDIDKVTRAIAAFEETLVTPNARFDRWLRGDKRALDADELQGWQLFKQSGCIACHYGEALGGRSFERMGVMEPYRSRVYAQGRAAVTGDDIDRFSFKVPTLRNVELTSPYFHDGAATTLAEAVDVMGRLQLGRKYSRRENAQIVAFLKTLTGEQPRIVLPVLPPSSDRTPRP